MTQEQVMGIVRHALTFVGGILVLKGFTDDATLLEVSGLITTAIGAIWSVVNKIKGK
jgi:hypothetical protein